MQMKTGIHVTLLLVLNITNILCVDLHDGYFTNTYDPNKNCENEKLLEKLEKEGRCVGPFSKGDLGNIFFACLMPSAEKRSKYQDLKKLSGRHARRNCQKSW